ncbi:hypothetical protein [Gardnerella swidsinskii]
MSEFSKEFANDAIGAGEPYEALADYLSFAWEHQNTPRRQHSADYDEDE